MVAFSHTYVSFPAMDYGFYIIKYARKEKENFETLEPASMYENIKCRGSTWGLLEASDVSNWVGTTVPTYLDRKEAREYVWYAFKWAIHTKYLDNGYNNFHEIIKDQGRFNF